MSNIRWKPVSLDPFFISYSSLIVDRWSVIGDRWADIFGQVEKVLPSVQFSFLSSSFTLVFLRFRAHKNLFFFSLFFLFSLDSSRWKERKVLHKFPSWQFHTHSHGKHWAVSTDSSWNSFLAESFLVHNRTTMMNTYPTNDKKEKKRKNKKILPLPLPLPLPKLSRGSNSWIFSINGATFNSSSSNLLFHFSCVY